MKILRLVFCLLIFQYCFLFAQKENSNWLFGDGVGITFQNGDPVVFNGSKIKTKEGCSAISDAQSGSLLFYTDGVSVWNAKHGIVPNGTGLSSGSSSTQGALIVKSPANANEYFIFTVPNLTSYDITEDFAYTIVNTTSGVPVITQKNVFISKGMTEKLTATKTCSGKGYWIAVHHAKECMIYTYLLDETGFHSTPIITKYDNLQKNHDTGYMKFSADGRHIAVASTMDNDEVAHLVILDFDNYTGKCSNPVELHRNVKAKDFYGICFSPNSQLLYATCSPIINNETKGRAILQFDLSLYGKKSHTIFNTKDSVYSLHTAPNGKIYVTELNRKSLGVINSPNKREIQCDYKSSAISLPRLCFYGLPNVIDYEISELTSDTLETCQFNEIQIGIPNTNAYSYLWTPTEGLSNSRISNPVFNYDKSVSYTLRVIKNDACTTYHNVYVNVLNNPLSLKVHPTYALVCQGSVITLHASGGTSYKWSPTQGLNNPNIADPVCTVTKDITYTVTIENGSCSAKKNVEIKAGSSPIANAGIQQYICSDDSVTIGTPEIKGEIYLWKPVIGLSNPSLAQPKAFPFVNTMYYLQVNRGDRCVSTDSVMVYVGALQARVSEDTTICAGDNLQLFAYGGTTYSWFPKEGLSDPDISNPVASPRISTRYKVIVGNGSCIDSAFVMIDVVKKPANHVRDTITTCFGKTKRIGREYDPEFQYEWTPSDNLDFPNSPQPLCSAAKSALYIRKAMNKNMCIAYDTTFFEVAPEIKLSLTKDTTICPQQELQLFATGTDQYRWSPAESMDRIDIANPRVKPEATTVYYVQGTTGNCSVLDSVRVTVREVKDIIINTPAPICVGASVELSASEGADSYEWTPTTGLENPKNYTTKATPATTTTYTVKALFSECIVEKNVTVFVNEYINKKFDINVEFDSSVSVGGKFAVQIHVPAGLQSSQFIFNYDDCCLIYEGIIKSSFSDVQVIRNKGDITFNCGNTANSEEYVVLGFSTLVPIDSRKQEYFTINNVHANGECVTPIGDTVSVNLKQECAWNLRPVLGHEKFDIVINNDAATLNTGIGGKITVEIFDLMGQIVWESANNYPSSSEEKVTLPQLMNGTYIIRAKNYNWKKDIIINK